MKRFFIIMILVTICLFTGIALADNSCGQNVTWTLSDTGVLTISGNGPMSSYRYSSDLPWNDQSKNITSVVVEDGVTSIGDKAFYWCGKIKTISLPESVISIGKYAFENCNDLTTIKIPSGVTVIPEWCFYGCDKLTSIALPDGLTTIDELAFGDCESLTEIVIPASVKYISDDRVFKGCDKLLRITVSPDNSSYKTVDGVLFNADQTKLICYPAGKTDISYTVPNSVTNICPYAFYWNEYIMSINVPGSVEYIGDDAFAGCKKMTSITMAEGVVSIGSTAFHQCQSLTTIKFPASLVSLGDDMFEDCYKLSQIEITEGSAAYVSVDGVLYSADRTRIVAYPPAANKSTYIIPEGVTIIGKYAFLYNKNLVSVTFPSTLLSIESSAFSGCDKITILDLPEGLISLDYHAFFSCDALSTVTIPNSCTSLGDCAFGYCKHLTSVYVKNPNTRFNKWGVFDNCGNALTVYAPAGSTAEEHCTQEKIRFVAHIFDASPSAHEPGQDDASIEDAWVCPECGNEMIGGKFCYECGAARPQEQPQAQICDNCGYEVPEGFTMKFCPECGTKFD